MPRARMSLEEYGKSRKKEKRDTLGRNPDILNAGTHIPMTPTNAIPPRSDGQRASRDPRLLRAQQNLDLIAKQNLLPADAADVSHHQSSGDPPSAGVEPVGTLSQLLNMLLPEMTADNKQQSLSTVKPSTAKHIHQTRTTGTRVAPQNPQGMRSPSPTNEVGFSMRPEFETIDTSLIAGSGEQHGYTKQSEPRNIIPAVGHSATTSPDRVTPNNRDTTQPEPIGPIGPNPVGFDDQEAIQRFHASSTTRMEMITEATDHNRRLLDEPTTEEKKIIVSQKIIRELSRYMQAILREKHASQTEFERMKENTATEIDIMKHGVERIMQDLDAKTVELINAQLELQAKDKMIADAKTYAQRTSRLETTAECTQKISALQRSLQSAEILSCKHSATIESLRNALTTTAASEKLLKTQLGAANEKNAFIRALNAEEMGRLKKVIDEHRCSNPNTASTLTPRFVTKNWKMDPALPTANTRVIDTTKGMDAAVQTDELPVQSFYPPPASRASAKHEQPPPGQRKGQYAKTPVSAGNAPDNGEINQDNLHRTHSTASTGTQTGKPADTPNAEKFCRIKRDIPQAFAGGTPTRWTNGFGESHPGRWNNPEVMIPSGFGPQK